MSIYRFTDNLDIVSDKPIRVRALITMRPTDQGGRHGPFSNGLSPNHNFQGPDDTFFFIGRIQVEEGVLVYPGETRELVVTFLDAQGLRELLVPGRTWRLHEGRCIGTATVITVEE